MVLKKCIILVVTLIALSGAALGDQSLLGGASNASQSDPYVHTERYNTFPWTFGADYAYVVGVSPLLKAPTNPPAWSIAPGLIPGFIGGPGMLVVLRYTDSPIADYSELFYVPGSFLNVGCPNMKQLSSVQRIWVSSPYSQRAGRNIWGIPKELADFDWQEDANGVVKVTVTDKSNTTFFRATFSKTPMPRSISYPLSSVVQGFMGRCLNVVQWPIDDNTNKTAYADVPVYKTTQMAAATKPYTIVKSPICFNIKDGTINKVNDAFMDPVTFTGRKNDILKVSLLGYRLPANIEGTLGVPKLLKCWSALRP